MNDSSKNLICIHRSTPKNIGTKNRKRTMSLVPKKIKNGMKYNIFFFRKMFFFFQIKII